jgi:hypothetical protein
MVLPNRSHLFLKSEVDKWVEYQIMQGLWGGKFEEILAMIVLFLNVYPTLVRNTKYDLQLGFVQNQA